MKKSNPILNVLTAILASVGGCTAVLSCFIIFHAVFIGEFGVPDNKSATRETALIQSGSIPQETASIQSSSLPEGFSLPLLLPEEIPSMAASAGIDTADDEDHAGSQSVEAYQAETEVDSIPLKYYQALNRANAYSDTMHMPKADIYEQLVFCIWGLFSCGCRAVCSGSPDECVGAGRAGARPSRSGQCRNGFQRYDGAGRSRSG